MLPEVIIISGTGAPSFGIRHYPYAELVGLYSRIGYTVHLESIYHLGVGRIEKSLSHLQRVYFSDTDTRQYIVLGHSQGGLLALALGNEHPDRVVAIEIFGAPLYGTRLAPSWTPLPITQALNSHSHWLRGLRQHENLDVTKVHSYFSALDGLVVPWVASMVNGGHNHLLVPSQIKSVALAVGRTMIGDKIDQAQILYGSGGHLKLVTHPAIISSLAMRYRSVDDCRA